MKSLPQSFTVLRGGTARFPCIASVIVFYSYPEFYSYLRHFDTEKSKLVSTSVLENDLLLGAYLTLYHKLLSWISLYSIRHELRMVYHFRTLLN